MKHFLFFLVLLIGIILTPDVPSAAGAPLDGPLQLTMARFHQVPCMEDEQYRYHRDTIRALSYSRMRVLRAFCTLPDIMAPEAIKILERLVFSPVTFDQARLFESFLTLPGVSSADGWRFLELTTGLEYTATQAAGMLANIGGLVPENVFYLIERLEKLDDSGRWAAKALFSVRGIEATPALAGVNIISTMSQKQRWAAERGCLLAAGNAPIAIEIMRYISAFSDTDAVNIAALFSVSGLSPETGLYWLRHYFSRSHTDEETIYYSLSAPEKATLLLSYSEASDYLIWKINNLHAVTNEYGTEISTGTLTASSPATITALFERLEPEAQRRYRSALRDALAAGRPHDAVETLKRATALARQLTARDLTSANIYALLARGSELYDSSFRDILVPALLERITASFDGRLLEFLIQTDPLNAHVSDFIISCAQKGKLTAFFPEDPDEQLRILDLVTSSAFQDEASLILFSATFSTLLEKIQPPVRSYLVARIIETIDRPDSIFALQLRVILQYYLDKHPDLLSEADRSRIGGLVDRYGAVDLKPYTSTDFTRWKQDGRLASLSVFQQDDDGRFSYHSYCRHLISHGYTPRLSTMLSLLPEDGDSMRRARQLLIGERQHPGSMIGLLFSLSARTPVIFEWSKQVNGIELSHAVAVYQDKVTQRLLLRQFLETDMEMFAQRGHSYWREEQLLDPMRHLWETGEIGDRNLASINRFMSIGSCGGIRVYTELNKLFNNSIDILATVGTGKAIVNDPYNQRLFEIIASSADDIGWEEIARRSESIFAQGRGSDYLLPGSLPAILHKMMDTRTLN